ncbi:MAG: C10 family peptidase [Alistipes sp.]|nr:C10 family peptidase [Alistipes sp.]
MNRIIFYLIAGFAVVSCNQNQGLNQLKASSNEASGYAIPLRDVVEQANAILSEIDGAKYNIGSDDFNTRNVTRKIKSVDYITANSEGCSITRSGDAEPALYLINYEDGKGFALMGADTRFPYAYAVSNEGYLDLSDTLYNDGLAIVFKMITDDVINRLNVGETRGKFSETYKTMVKTEEMVQPWLGDMEVKGWNQGAPYNQYCLTDDGQTAQVGCAAVALAQIMAHHKFPTLVDNVVYDWEEMINGDNNDAVAMFMAKLGEESNLNMEYGTVSSTSYNSALGRTLTNMGYVHDGLTDYNSDALMEYLSNDTYPYGPAFVRGSRMKDNGEITGHAWVIDGYILQGLYIANGTINGGMYDYVFQGYLSPLMHCIWGWGGSCNGYYYVNPNSPQFDLSEGPENTDGYLEGYGSMNSNYNLNIKVITGINRQ